MAIGAKKQADEAIFKEYHKAERELKQIYSNKSSDEYKMHGDITASSAYDSIESMIADLSDLKGFNKSEAREYSTMFSTLHRPIFKRMVTEYMHSPNETNVTYTLVFTVGYRVLVGELSRILACTECTESGISYKMKAISAKNQSKWIVKNFNSSMESSLNAYIKTHAKKKTVKQEGAITELVSLGLDAASIVIDTVKRVFSFGSKEVNPFSFINAILMSSYDKKVKKYEDAKKDYDLAKEAYADYLKLPKSDRKRRVESKYMKQITKYNIRMQNLKAKIDHYDQRAEAESRDKREKMKTDRILNGNDDDDKKDDKKSDSSSKSSDGGSAYDFDF